MSDPERPPPRGPAAAGPKGGRPSAPTSPASAAADPVIERRRRIAGYVSLGQRVGYGLFGLAIVVFVVGFVVGLQPWAVTLIIVSLVIGSIVLAPAIVFGHAVHAANRADREGSW